MPSPRLRRRWTTRFTTWLGCATFALAAALSTSTAAFAGDELVLDMYDMAAAPGRLAVLVLRSYQARPISQGQVVFDLNDSAVVRIPRSIVRSQMDDATHTSMLMNSSRAEVLMESPTSSINSADGPILLLALRISPDAVPGSVYPVDLQLLESRLSDELGQPITIDADPVTLTIKAPGTALELTADSTNGESGAEVDLDIQTEEMRRLSAGHIEYLYDPAILTSINRVEVYAHHKKVEFAFDASTPGRVIIDFTSDENRVNLIPGPIATISADVAPGLPDRLESPLALDPATTWLRNSAGELVDILFDDGRFRVRND